MRLRMRRMSLWVRWVSRWGVIFVLWRFRASIIWVWKILKRSKGWRLRSRKDYQNPQSHQVKPHPVMKPATFSSPAPTPPPKPMKNQITPTSPLSPPNPSCKTTINSCPLVTNTDHPPTKTAPDPPDNNNTMSINSQSLTIHLTIAKSQSESEAGITKSQ